MYRKKPSDQFDLPLEPPVSAREQAVVMQQVGLAGYRHHEAPDLDGFLCAGQSLELIAEPDNPHDPHAVMVAWRGRKLGYLPRGANLFPSVMLGRGRALFARVVRVQPQAARNERVSVEVGMWR
ncbi:MAG: HIRAN domain-containing protein [Gammaproteobacteria bacterium]